MYARWKNAALRAERHILKELGFALYELTEHPHKFILYYVECLEGSAALAQRSWNYLNDGLRLDLCCRFRAPVIACAAILAAARDLQIRLPRDPPWFELFGASLDEMDAVCARIEAYAASHRKARREGQSRWLTPLGARDRALEETGAEDVQQKCRPDGLRPTAVSRAPMSQSAADAAVAAALAAAARIRAPPDGDRQGGPLEGAPALAGVVERTDPSGASERKYASQRIAHRSRSRGRSRSRSRGRSSRSRSSRRMSRSEGRRSRSRSRDRDNGGRQDRRGRTRDEGRFSH
jgi:hypothetical protein